MSPILLIAEREFRTYVATLSFWLSLAVAPLAAGAALFFSGGHQPPSLITLKGDDSAIMRSVGQAVQEAGRLEGRKFVFGSGGANIVLSQRDPRILNLTFGADFPLSAVGRAMVRHVIERDAAREAARQAPLVVSENVAPSVAEAAPGAASRLIAMIMLWLTLTGSLGMLLQAVVRERANRALESLLASARAWQVVMGKLLGVGAVSLLVLVVWSGTAVLLSLLAKQDTPLSAIMAGISDKGALARDALIYFCAYLFYGTMTVALGAVARDSAAAQNAARPMFMVLLAAFLVALTTFASPSAAVSWLRWLAPLTPFLLLTEPSADVALMTQACQLGLLLLASAGLSVLAALLIKLAPGTLNIFQPRCRLPQ